MFKTTQSILDQIRKNRDYQCLSLQPDTAAKALKAAQKTGQRVCILAETYGRTHVIFVAKDFQNDTWAEGFFRFAKDVSTEFSGIDLEIFGAIAEDECTAAALRLSAAVNGYIYCRDETMPCGKCQLVFYKG